MIMKKKILFLAIYVVTHITYSQTQIETSEIWYSNNSTVFGNSGNVLEPYPGYNTQNNRLLQIRGNTTSYGIPSLTFVKTSHSNNYGGALLWLSDNLNNTDKRFAQINGDIINGGGNINFNTRKESDSQGFFNSMIFNENGYLGIGTSQPAFQLHVSGNFGTAGNRFAVAQGVINQNSTIENWGSGSNQGGMAFNYDGRQTPYGASQALFRDFSIYNGKGEIIGFFDGSNKSLGIGTFSTGTHKLAVEGSIGAREIKVEASGWSDFVFYKDYKLPTLEEVEQYITDNGHLPEIPSESEVTENGINLGEMDAKLLQKIEELTLYLIEQSKEIKELKTKNENLQERLIFIEKKS